MSKEEAAFDDWQNEQVAFDNWEAEAQKEAEVPNTQETKQIEEAKNESITNKEQKVQLQKKPVDLPKSVLQKIQEHKQITNQYFPSYFEKIKEKSTNEDIILSNQILKSDKDFIKFAKAVSQRLNKEAEEQDLQTLQQGNVLTFVQQLLLLLYEQLQWKNLESTKQKLKIVKKQKKDYQKQVKKQKQRQEILKRFRKAEEQEEANRPKYENKVEDDIFEGAALINSKQVEDERKNKQIKKVQAPPAEDDDDFM